MTKRHMTKRCVFDEAVRLFAEKGYKAVALKQIAEAVGITETELYQYYKNKTEILDGIFVELKKKIQKYILTRYEVDKCIETDTSQQLFERYLKILNAEEEDSVFISRAYRILKVEYLTNEKAMELLAWWIQDALVESIQYAIDKMIERKSIPPCDTWFYAMLWTNYIFTETVRKMIYSVLKGDTKEWAEKNELFAKHLIQMMITKKGIY